jgi:hypothetical protein
MLPSRPESRTEVSEDVKHRLVVVYQKLHLGASEDDVVTDGISEAAAQINKLCSQMMEEHELKWKCLVPIVE